MRFLDRLFASRRRRATLTLAHARAAELRGQLAHAAALFEQAGRADEAARVVLLQGDAAIETSERLAYYLQAARTAPEGSAVAVLARRKRANLLLAAAGEDSVPSAGLRQALLEVARELEDRGEHETAAEAYARGGSEEGQARSLARAGDVDRLDALLLERQGRDRRELSKRRAHGELRSLIETGRRREALALAREWRDDEGFQELARSLEARRVEGAVLRATLKGRKTILALGEQVVVGRVAPIAITSAVVSREHLSVARRGGDVVVRDLGSANGTTMRGLRLDAGSEARVGDGIELLLGGQVPIRVQPTADLQDAVAIEVAGVRYVAPLGPARLGAGTWRLEQASDGWVELATSGNPHAYSGALQLAERVTLLAGDVVACDRDGAPVLEVDRE